MIASRAKVLLLSISLLALVACGGGGGGDAEKSTPTNTTGTVNYTQPTGNPGQPVLVMNSTLSKDGTIVFDVVGDTPSVSTRGVVLNLQVDGSKIVPVEVPGSLGANLHKTGLGIDTAGFGGGQTVLMRQDKSDGTALMVLAIRNPAPVAPCSGPLMRFAYKVQGSPVTGVIRAQVLSGSGVLDASGRVINGTSPAIGRLEIK